MRLALIQCDAKTGDFTANSEKIKKLIQKLNNVELCIIPAGALTGPDVHFGADPAYPLAIRKVIDGLALNLKDGPALLGHAPAIGYFLAHAGKWEEVNNQFEFAGCRLGVDMRPQDAAKIDIGIAMKPRPFAPDSNAEWELIFSGFCRQSCIWGLYVNLCGGYGSNIYAGGSFAMTPDGTVAAMAKLFDEDCLLVDTGLAGWRGRIETTPATREETTWLALTLGLRDFMHKRNNPDVFIGLSGGMDSALTATIAQAALGAEKLTGVLMPSPYTSPDSIKDAQMLAANLGIKTLQIPILPLLESFKTTLAPCLASLSQLPGEVMHENIQARLRGMILMALANYHGGMVLNCGNKSEAAMGYCTLYGDTAGAVAVIGDLFKTQVYRLAKWYCEKAGTQIIPENIFRKAPSAELRPNQKDTDTLPPYAVLDPQLEMLLNNATPENAETAMKMRELEARVRRFAYKRRQSPPALHVSDNPLATFDA